MTTKRGAQPVGVVAPVRDQALHANGFANEQIGALDVGCVSWRQDEAQRSSKEIATSAWIFVACHHAKCQWLGLEPPFCAAGTPMHFHIAAVDLRGLRDPALVGQCGKDAAPHAAPAPPVPAIVDRREWTIVARAVLPSTAALEHVNDARNHPPIIDPPRAGWFFGRCGSIAAHAAPITKTTIPPCPSLLKSETSESAHQSRIKLLIGFGP